MKLFASVSTSLVIHIIEGQDQPWGVILKSHMFLPKKAKAHPMPTLADQYFSVGLFVIEDSCLFIFHLVSSAVYQGGLFGVCGMMPQKYTGAVMTGQVIHLALISQKSNFHTYGYLTQNLRMLPPPPSPLLQCAKG